MLDSQFVPNISTNTNTSCTCLLCISITTFPGYRLKSRIAKPKGMLPLPNTAKLLMKLMFKILTPTNSRTHTSSPTVGVARHLIFVNMMGVKVSHFHFNQYFPDQQRLSMLHNYQPPCFLKKETTALLTNQDQVCECNIKWI